MGTHTYEMCVLVCRISRSHILVFIEFGIIAWGDTGASEKVERTPSVKRLLFFLLPQEVLVGSREPTFFEGMCSGDERY